MAKRVSIKELPYRSEVIMVMGTTGTRMQITYPADTEHVQYEIRKIKTIDEKLLVDGSKWIATKVSYGKNNEYMRLNLTAQ